MAIYFSFQAALCFSIAHILIRRGLVESNAMTGSFISLTMSALVLWLLVPFIAPLSALWTPFIAIFLVAGILAPGIGRTLSYVGIEKIGVARSVPIANSSPIFASVFAVVFLAETWVPQNILGTVLVIGGRHYSLGSKAHPGRVAQARRRLSLGRRYGIRRFSDLT
jgi:drug/metabolite transporter (DMT)-like permease